MTEEDEGEPPLPLRVSAASEPLPFDVPAVYSEPLPFDVSSVSVGLDEWLSLQLEASEALLASAKQEHAALLSSLAKPPTIEMEDLIGGRLSTSGGVQASPSRRPQQTCVEATPARPTQHSAAEGKPHTGSFPAIETVLAVRARRMHLASPPSRRTFDVDSPPRPRT